MKKAAVFFFALWLITAYMLVYALADSRHKGQTIQDQKATIEGAHSVARQVMELYNRRHR